MISDPQLDFLVLTLVPMLVATLAALACAVPGNFLILRRQAMLGDTMSHVVLPGIVTAFLLTGSASGMVMTAGALIAAGAAALLIEGLRRIGVESGASMGVVYTTLFASGVLLLESGGLAGIHLDVEHALYGNLESLLWLGAEGWGSLADPASLATLPPELGQMAMVAAITGLAVALLWRPLAISTFDEGFAATIGLPVRLLGAGLVAMTALAAVAAFTAVGAILTVAMLICPAAAARLITRRLGAQLGLSLIFAATSAILGMILAGHGPLWLGFDHSVSAAGMIAVVAGLILALCAGLPGLAARLRSFQAGPARL